MIKLFKDFMKENKVRMRVVVSKSTYGEENDVKVYLLPEDSKSFWDDDVKRDGVLVHSE